MNFRRWKNNLRDLYAKSPTKRTLAKTLLISPDSAEVANKERRHIVVVGSRGAQRPVLEKLNSDCRFEYLSIRHFDSGEIPSLPETVSAIIFNTAHTKIPINTLSQKIGADIHRLDRCLKSSIGDATRIEFFTPGRIIPRNKHSGGNGLHPLPTRAELTSQLASLADGMQRGERSLAFFEEYRDAVAMGFAVLPVSESVEWFRKYFGYRWEGSYLTSDIIDSMNSLIEMLGKSGFAVPDNLVLDYCSAMAQVGNYGELWKHFSKLQPTAKSRATSYLGLTDALLKMRKEAKRPGFAKAATLYKRLTENESQLTRLFREAGSDVKIIGNGPQAKGSNLGREIDKSHLVVRFNTFDTSFPHSQDYGTRTDIWVRMVPHAYVRREPVLRDIQLVAVTGCNRLYRNYSNWDWFYASLDTIPNLCWYPSQPFIELCDLLGRVPTSGLLAAYTLYKEVGPLKADTVIGTSFSTEETGTDVYHYSDASANISLRHSIEAEREFFQTLLLDARKKFYTPLHAERTFERARQTASLRTAALSPRATEPSVDDEPESWSASKFLEGYDKIYTTSQGLSGYKVGNQQIEFVEPGTVPKPPSERSLVLGFGLRGSAKRAINIRQTLGNDIGFVEYGLISGISVPSKTEFKFSLIIDDIGIFFDATRPSRTIELLSNDPTLDQMDNLYRARKFISNVVNYNVVKYNDAPCLDIGGRTSRRRILLFDQTKGDLSIELGECGNNTFDSMLEHALSVPNADIYLKLHPETVHNVKEANYDLERLSRYNNVRLIHQNCNSLHLIKQVDEVYVMTSGAGLEGLMAGRQVTCFGSPFYSGWGLTVDIQDVRRPRPRSIEEIVAALFFRQTIWFHPETHEPCSAEQAIEALIGIRGELPDVRWSDYGFP